MTGRRSSGCVQTILFLTDGEDSSGFQVADLKDLDLEGVVLFTYTLGDGAAKELPKEMACASFGIWNHIPDGGDVENTMAKYYMLFAANIDATQARWVEY